VRSLQPTNVIPAPEKTRRFIGGLDVTECEKWITDFERHMAASLAEAVLAFGVGNIVRVRPKKRGFA